MSFLVETYRQRVMGLHALVESGEFTPMDQLQTCVVEVARRTRRHGNRTQVDNAVEILAITNTSLAQRLRVSKMTSFREFAEIKLEREALIQALLWRFDDTRPSAKAVFHLAFWMQVCRLGAKFDGKPSLITYLELASIQGLIPFTARWIQFNEIGDTREREQRLKEFFNAAVDAEFPAELNSINAKWMAEIATTGAKPSIDSREPCVGDFDFPDKGIGNTHQPHWENWHDANSQFAKWAPVVSVAAFELMWLWEAKK